MWSENRLTGNCENVVKAQKLIFEGNDEKKTEMKDSFVCGEALKISCFYHFFSFVLSARVYPHQVHIDIYFLFFLCKFYYFEHFNYSLFINSWMK